MFAGRDRLLAEHRGLLERWRRITNLVGPGPVDRHYDDALAALDGLEPRGRWADLGTGAGFPGVVLAARFPAIEVALVDSRSKRCAFLEEVVQLAGAEGVEVVCGRIEDLPAGAWDGVTARALAPLPDVLAYADRLLRPDGQALLLVGDDERPAERPALVRVGERRYRVDGVWHRAWRYARPGA
ncbi:MAG TPA: 16S rRNA (guanine(527)-N(7))-methyltransferase RsmG [Myxococcota bacterium]|nr:16S rRNA (guanine(527)-N(7))-methyltransferase RsmG [Myxococcota bacterium]